MHYLTSKEYKYIVHKLTQLEREVFHMSQELDNLTAAVAAEDTVIDSAVALINGFAAELDAKVAAAVAAATAAQAAGTVADLSALTALSTDVKAKADALAAAVAANTPAAPTA